MILTSLYRNQHLFFILFLYYNGIQDPHFKKSFFQMITGLIIQSCSKFDHFIKFLIWYSRFFQTLTVPYHCIRPFRLRLFLIFPFRKLYFHPGKFLFFQIPFMLFCTDICNDPSILFSPFISHFLADRHKIRSFIIMICKCTQSS